MAHSSPTTPTTQSPITQAPAHTSGSDRQLSPEQQQFERILASEPFRGLKAIFDRLTSDRAALYEGVTGTRSYEDLLTRLGYPTHLTPQVHVQDAYTRLTPAGGIKAVITYHDIPSHSSLPTLVNLDSTVTTTPQAAAFFNKLLATLKVQLSAQS